MSPLVESLAYLLPQVLILVASAILVSKKQNTWSVLILIGAIIGLLTSLGMSVIFLIIDSIDPEKVYKMLGLVGLVGGMIFAVGMLILATETNQEK